MNDVALRANDVLRNDVGLRPMMLRFAQTDSPHLFLPRVLKNTANYAIIKKKHLGGLMKSCIKLTAVLLLFVLVLSFASCGSLSVPIEFGEEYTAKGKGNYIYVFEKDGTGYRMFENTKTEFLWREFSNGAVVLIKTSDNDESIIDDPIYFGEDCFYYFYTTQYSSGNTVYVVEGSDLDEALNEK